MVVIPIMSNKAFEAKITNFLPQILGGIEISLNNGHNGTI